MAADSEPLLQDARSIQHDTSGSVTPTDISSAASKAPAATATAPAFQPYLFKEGTAEARYAANKILAELAKLPTRPLASEMSNSSLPSSAPGTPAIGESAAACSAARK